MKKLVLVLLVLTVTLGYLNADVYVKQKTHTSAFMGQPEKNAFTEMWFGNNKMATISPDQSVILDLQAKKFYMINHKSKSYVVADLPLDITKLMPEQMAQMMKGMMGQISITLQANGQKKKIGSWNANGYDALMKIMGMETKTVFWASKDVPFDWKAFATQYADAYKAQFMSMGEKFFQEFKKMEGFVVGSEMSMMGMTVNTEVVEINPNKAPGATVYSVPAGYVKKDKLDMGMGAMK